MVKFTKTVQVKASTNKVWKIFAHDFNDAYKWMASVPHSYANSNGQLFDGAKSDGRICELGSNPNGMKASEHFLAYNEEAKTATVRINFLNTPKLFPVKFNTLDFSIVALNENESEMTWKFRSDLKFFGWFMWPALRKGFDVFVTQIIDELVYYAENDAPHPRKVKAMKKHAAKKSA